MICIYDNSFEGFLTCVFDYYKHPPSAIHPKRAALSDLFEEHAEVYTDVDKAERVWKAVQNKLSKINKQLLFYAFLSEEQGIEMIIFRFIQKLFTSTRSIESDYGDSDVLHLVQIAQKVKREAMRMLQFVRFQNTKDDMYFCGIEPLFDVLPLVTKHFQKRYADQKWLLYDLKRNYGILYDTQETEEVVISNKQFDRLQGQVNKNVLHESEDEYQTLWKSYFHHINIKERKNLRLQRQHLPKRFWKYLPEMEGKG